MITAARELKVTLLAGIPIPGMVYAARSLDDGPILIGAPVMDLEKVTLADLSRGAILGVVYLQLPPMPDPRVLATAIPAGFYKLRVIMTAPPTAPGVLNAKAQFIDKSEKVVRELPATVGTSERPTVGAKFTAEIGDNEVCVDFHWGRFEFEVCVSW